MGQHRLLAYVDDGNLLATYINTIKENTEALLNVRKEVGVEINTDKTK
jgi:hypothetical protein